MSTRHQGRHHRLRQHRHRPDDQGHADSEHLEMGAMVGIDPDSDGLARAARLGVADHRTRASTGSSRCPGSTTSRSSSTPPRPRPTWPTPPSSRPTARRIDRPDARRDRPVRRPRGQPRRSTSTRRNVNMVTCGGQATIPIVAAIAGSPRSPTPRSSPRSRRKSAGPGTRANIDEFTETTSRAIEAVGGARRGKAIIILNPAEPPLIMRDTVLCLDRLRRRPRDAIRDVGRGDGRRRRGVRPRLPPQAGGAVHRRSPPTSRSQTLLADGRAPRPTHQVSVFLEVEGAAHYLPAYAGNLDIMTSAALRVAERMAPTSREGGRPMSTPDLRPGRHPARRHARRPPPHHARRRRADRRRARRGRRRRHRGRPRRRPRRRLASTTAPASNTDWEWIEAAAVGHPERAG